MLGPVRLLTYAKVGRAFALEYTGAVVAPNHRTVVLSEAKTPEC